ncbi:MAG: hypothetical protein HY820_34300 [Acidobacteria bacterium]|nr:hypothetical protein [Acidobacteriota bacterium]
MPGHKSKTAASPPGRSGAHQQFTTALDALVENVRKDKSILAAILCGSLSYDTVWDKSDIDLVLVTIDNKNTDEGFALYADGVNVHALLMTRADFRKSVEGAIRNSFHHSFFAKGRLLYTHDDTIAEHFDQLHSIGERDTRIQLMGAAADALRCIYKAHKFFITRRDLEYTALWILHAATGLARIEVLSARVLADREVLLQALKINPQFFAPIYTELLNRKKDAATVEGLLKSIDAYMLERAPRMLSMITEYLQQAGELRSANEMEHHFHRTYGFSCVTPLCEYLADQGIIGKASLPLRLTKHSNVTVEELAFFHIDSRMPSEF